MTEKLSPSQILDSLRLLTSSIAHEDRPDTTSAASMRRIARMFTGENIITTPEESRGKESNER